MRRRLLFLFLLLFSVFIFPGCDKNDSQNRKLDFHIHHAFGWTVYLETIPFLNNEMPVVIDSAKIKSGDDHIIFNFPSKEERPYRIRMKESALEVIVINDSKEVTVEANILKPAEYSSSGSPATESLRKFLVNQSKLAEENRNESLRLKDLENAGVSKRMVDSMMNKSLHAFFLQYVNFADTVSSPGLFLAVVKYIEFGRDFAGQKKFITKAAERFPANATIISLKNETLDFLKVFEEEHEVGQYLPSLTLPDATGNQFSTDIVKGKYVFMDFWSTWCDECLRYDPEKLKAKKLFPASKFEIVSIAIDAEKENWKTYVAKRGYSWPNLIDEKMWDGEVNRLYRIDSIPFNFLLGPDGKILSKAIKKDSLISVLSEFIK